MSEPITSVADNILNVENIRKDFPVLTQIVRGKPLIYLDNAATTHKPSSVIERISKFDAEEYGTVRRGASPGGGFTSSFYPALFTGPSRHGPRGVVQSAWRV